MYALKHMRWQRTKPGLNQTRVLLNAAKQLNHGDASYFLIYCITFASCIYDGDFRNDSRTAKRIHPEFHIHSQASFQGARNVKVQPIANVLPSHNT